MAYTSAQLSEKIKQIVAKDNSALMNPRSLPKANFVDDLGADSLDRGRTRYSVRRELRHRDQLKTMPRRCSTVEDVQKYLEKRLKV